MCTTVKLVVLISTLTILFGSIPSHGYHSVETIHDLAHPYKTEIYTAEIIKEPRRYLWCADQIRREDAIVLCNQMSYDYPKLGLYSLSTSRIDFGALKYDPAVDEAFMNETFACTGEESRLADCPLRFVAGTRCPSGLVGQVDCLPADNKLKALTVNLLGAYAGDARGVVTLESTRNFHGLAGVICVENGGTWGVQEARVVCRSMGYDDQFAWPVDPAVVTNSTSLEGLRYAIKDVQCDGTEANINECVHTDMCMLTDHLSRYFSCPETCNGEPAAVICTLQ